MLYFLKLLSIFSLESISLGGDLYLVIYVVSEVVCYSEESPKIARNSI